MKAVKAVIRRQDDNPVLDDFPLEVSSSENNLPHHIALCWRNSDQIIVSGSGLISIKSSIGSQMQSARNAFTSITPRGTFSSAMQRQRNSTFRIFRLGRVLR